MTLYLSTQENMSENIGHMIVLSDYQLILIQHNTIIIRGHSLINKFIALICNPPITIYKCKKIWEVLIIIYFENVTFFHTKLDVCPG